jgi:glutamate--cysteine ligase
MSRCPNLLPAALDQSIEALLLGSPMSRGRRLLGVEFERLILHRDTRESAPLDFCRQLLADLVQDLGAIPVEDGGVLHKMNAGDFGISMEPGGQLEVATAPRACLEEVDRIMFRVSAAIEARLKDSAYELVCLGHTPVTRPEDIGLLPRHRYQIMAERMPERGALSINMMRATAGLQMAFDVTGRRDAGRKLALLYRLSPVLMAICANSREVGGEDSGYASFRHRVWLDTDRARSGIPDGCMHSETAIEGYVAYAKRAIVLFLGRNGDIVPSPARSLEDLVAEGRVTLEDLDLHLSSLFPFVRLRNYVEVRCFDSVEWPTAKGMLALLSGILYCPTATALAEELSAQLVVDDLTELHMHAARMGLDAIAPGGASFRDMATQLVDFAAAKVGKPDCNWAQLDDLEAVREVLRP